MAESMLGTLRRENDVLQTEIQILDQRCSTLEEKIQHYTTKYKELSTKYESSEETVTKQKQNIKRLQDLCDDYSTKYKEVASKNELLTIRREFSVQQISDTDVTSKSTQSNTEKQLREQLTSAEQTIIQKDNVINEKYKIIDNLADQLESAVKYKEKNGYLQRELKSMNEMAQQDMMLFREQLEKMTRETILLSARNSALENEKEELMTLLEERDYENQMLKTGYGLHRDRTNKLTVDNSNMQSIVNMYDEYDETLDDLSGYGIAEDTVVKDSYDMFLSEKRAVSKPEKKAVKNVADVVREYLHLTASVVNMKFPRIQTISSEELINKVKNYQFWEYHDMMIRIMKTEEQKILEKEKKERELKQIADTTKNKKGADGGILADFRNLFGDSNEKQRAQSRAKAKVPVRARTTSSIKLSDKRKHRKYPKD